jgi:hypothetical protein
VSKNAVNSPYVRAEVEFALNQRIRVLPVYLDGMDVLPPGLALGLNATQGVTNIDSPQVIAEQICNALIYNKIKKQDTPETGGPSEPAQADQELRAKITKRPLWRSAIVAGALAACIAVVFFLTRPDNKTAESPAEPRAAVTDPAPELHPVTTPPENPPENPPEQPAGVEGSATPKQPKQAPVPAKPVLALEKSTFAPVEPIYVTLPRLSPQAISRGAMICIAPAGAAHGQYITQQPITEQLVEKADTEKASAVIRLHVPAEHGKYEIRLYDNDQSLTSSSLIGSARFTVQGDSRGVFSVVIGKTSYAPQERIDIQVSNVAKRMIEDGALVGLFRKNAARGEFMMYENISDRDKYMSFDAPYEPGEYEIRAHINGILLDTPTLVVSLPFVVLAQQETAK